MNKWARDLLSLLISFVLAVLALVLFGDTDSANVQLRSVIGIFALVAGLASCWYLVQLIQHVYSEDKVVPLAGMLLGTILLIALVLVFG